MRGLDALQRLVFSVAPSKRPLMAYAPNKWPLMVLALVLAWFTLAGIVFSVWPPKVEPPKVEQKAPDRPLEPWCEEPVEPGAGK